MTATLVSTRSHLSSKYAVDSLTKLHPKLEAVGFLGHPDAALLAIARTFFKLLKGRKGNPANISAFELALEGAKKCAPDEVTMEVDPMWKLTGGLAYRAIREIKAKKVKKWSQSTTNLNNIIDNIVEVFGTRVSVSDVWKSIRSRHITRICSQFMWKTIHDLFMVGERWLTICPVCDNVESMDHILFRCDAVGQATIWQELKSLWAYTQEPWTEPGWGPALGAGCAVFKTEKGSRKLPSENLWTILWSEAVHLIWKIRYERVIHRQSEQFSEQEVVNRWHSTVDRRLTLDRRTAVLAKGKKDLRPRDVDRIWSPIIEDHKKLPEGWVGNSGVLVGIKRGQG
ncbi:hypothetical protein BD309DRAFT_993974 [Dichomitus squalens]|nr:hypothetical protein BD309DRAFT_993974 [Dichomitus squalens]